MEKMSTINYPSSERKEEIVKIITDTMKYPIENIIEATSDDGDMCLLFMQWWMMKKREPMDLHKQFDEYLQPLRDIKKKQEYDRITWKIKKKKREAENNWYNNDWHIIKKSSSFVIVIPIEKKPYWKNAKKFAWSVLIPFDYADNNDFIMSLDEYDAEYWRA